MPALSQQAFSVRQGLGRKCQPWLGLLHGVMLDAHGQRQASDLNDRQWHQLQFVD
jgi:hypothetical protein